MNWKFRVQYLKKTRRKNQLIIFNSAQHFQLLKVACNKYMSAANSDPVAGTAWHCAEKVYEKEPETEKMP